MINQFGKKFHVYIFVIFYKLLQEYIMNREIEEYFKENNIDPFRILNYKKGYTKKDVKKIYKLKALKLHPDKNNGKDYEFKLLRICYDYITSILEESNQQEKCHSDLKNDYNTIVKEDIYYEDEYKDFHKINFENQQTRDRLFVNNPIDFNDREAFIEKKRGGPIDYGKVDNDNNINLFKNRSFTPESFNAMFEIQVGEQEYTKQMNIDNVQGIDAYTSLSPLSIESYGGLIVEKRETDYNMKLLQGNRNIIQESFRDEKVDKHILLKSQEKEKYNKSVKKLYSERVKDNKKITVNTSLTFRENEDLLKEKFITDQKKEKEIQRENVLKYSGIYPKHIIEQFNSHRLNSSDIFTL